MSTIICKFDRLGRNQAVTPMRYEVTDVHLDPKALADAVYRYARSILGEKGDVDVEVDVKHRIGVVYSGVKTAGRFTIEEEVA